MSSRQGLQPLRAGVLLGLTAVLPVLVWRVARDPLRDVADAYLDAPSSAAPGFAAIVEAMAGLAALGCSVWLMLAGALVCWETFPGSAERSAATVWCRPDWLRRLVVAGGGATLGATLVAAPATALPNGPEPAPVAGPVLTAAPTGGLPVPDRATGRDDGGRAGRYAVTAGDSLWTIARRLLPEGSGVGDVADASRRIHRANRDRLGPDPDLIFPGTILRLPSPLTSGKDRP